MYLWDFCFHNTMEVNGLLFFALVVPVSLGVKFWPWAATSLVRIWPGTFVAYFHSYPCCLLSTKALKAPNIFVILFIFHLKTAAACKEIVQHFRKCAYLLFPSDQFHVYVLMLHSDNVGWKVAMRKYLMFTTSLDNSRQLYYCRVGHVRVKKKSQFSV